MAEKPKRVRKAVLPAAGLGTRFLPATKAQPKEMLPVVDKPLIQYVVEECVASGIDHIIIVTGRGKNAIEDHFDSSPELESFLEEKGKSDLAKLVHDIGNMVHFSYTRQKEPLGLGHAVLVARELVGNEPFAVLLGDDLVAPETPCLARMIELHEMYGGSVLSLFTPPLEQISAFGVAAVDELTDDAVKVNFLVEKPKREDAPSNLAV